MLPYVTKFFVYKETLKSSGSKMKEINVLEFLFHFFKLKKKYLFTLF